MNRDDYVNHNQMLHDREQAETRIGNLCEASPERTQSLMDQMLQLQYNLFLQRPSPDQELVYLVVWLGVQAVADILNNRIDLEDLERQDDEEQDGDSCDEAYT
jgi:hypothetical protein